MAFSDRVEGVRLGIVDRDGAQALMDEDVAKALSTLAEGIAAGVRIEEIEAPRQLLRTVYADVQISVFYEVRDVLVQQRDHGSIGDRIGNRTGNVPWPARLLDAGMTPGAHDSICDPRPEY